MELTEFAASAHAGESSSSEPDIAKLELLYRIPTAPERGRVLELSVNGDPIFCGPRWKGEVGVVCIPGSSYPLSAAPAMGAEGVLCCRADYAKTLPFHDGCFDLVILHRTLDHLLSFVRRDERDVVVDKTFAEVARVLTAGGIVAGCVENRFGLDNLLRGVKRAFGRSASAGGENSANTRRRLSAISCRSAMARAGFGDCGFFGVLPSIDFPKVLWSIDKGWSRRASRHQARALRPLVGHSSYVVWRMFAELGVSQNMGNAIFFWGRKVC